VSGPSPSQAAPRKVILDCDPGIDDAFAIAFGCGHPALELCGVTTVAGNAGLDRTTGNALAVLEFLGRPDVPVAAGSPAPLLRPFTDAHDVHGETGLGTASLPAPSGQPVAAHAVDFLIERIAAAPGEVTLVATGPLTNIALAVRRHPPLVTQVAGFVIMGGSAGRGNVTPAAEFNIWADPEAAAIVFAAGWQVTMAGLDVTYQALATAEVRDRLRALGRLSDVLLLPGLRGYQSLADAAGQPVHDVCALALVAAPHLFGCRAARVEVETQGRWTSGMTVTDFGADTPNALVAMSVDVPGFWDVVAGALNRAAAVMNGG
jgi:inosine-uridine nucleoside N-ribohydrolase